MCSERLDGDSPAPRRHRRHPASCRRPARISSSSSTRTAATFTGSLDTVRLIRSAPAAVRDLVVGFRRDLVDAPVHAVSLGARPPAGARPLARCAGRDSGRVGRARAGGALAGVARRTPALATEPEADETLIVTGFIARDPAGLQTTLGRNGSDFSASIFGDLLDADEIHHLDRRRRRAERRSAPACPTRRSSTRSRTTRRWSWRTSARR